MLYSQYWNLEGVVEDSVAKKLQSYFKSLLEGSSKVVTMSKILSSTGLPEGDVEKAIVTYCNRNILKISYAIRCPECEGIIKRLDKIEHTVDNEVECYMCEERFIVSEEDIIVLFEVNVEKPPFYEGQCEKADNKILQDFHVAPCDTLSHQEEYFKRLNEEAAKNREEEEYYKEAKAVAARKCRRNEKIQKAIKVGYFIFLLFSIIFILLRYKKSPYLAIIISVINMANTAAITLILPIFCEIDLEKMEKKEMMKLPPPSDV